MTKKKNIKPQDKAVIQENRDIGKYIIYAILFIHMVLAIIYWHLTPFGLPPDEGPHGKYIGLMADNHTLPVFNPSDRENYEFHQPPLYYTLGLPFHFIGSMIGIQDPAIIVRALSIILGALSIFVIYLTILKAFDNNRRLALACAGFAALLPTHSMLSSSVSNDILSELIYGLVLLLAASILIDGLSWRRTIVVGVVLGAGILTKTTCILLFPVVGLLYLMLAIRKITSWKTAFVHFAGASGVSLLIGGWWLVRNHLLYGDPFGLALFQQAFQHTAKPDFFFNQGLSVIQYLELVAIWTFESFWGVFGHMKIFMPSWIYVMLAVISIPFSILSLMTLHKIREDRSKKDFIMICAVVLGIVLLSFLRFNLSFFQAQGRYLYPALIPISILWCYGITKRISPMVIYGILIITQIIAISCIM
ncbi:MAG: ArnT family glycosyltransferase [Armatimonadota bacterium]